MNTGRHAFPVVALIGLIALLASSPKVFSQQITDADWESVNGLPGTNFQLFATASYGKYVYVGGEFDIINNVNANSVARWDGVSWTALGEGLMHEVPGHFAWVFALAVDAEGNLYAGGRFAEAGGIASSNIAKWDGTNWSPLGKGLDGSVHSLAFDSSGNLYAGGDFAKAGDVSASRIAMWNGTEWSAVGAGVDGDIVIALASDSSGVIYAGGRFSKAGGVAANNIARWNGTAWQAIGNGLGDGSSFVEELLFDASGSLLAGGNFDESGETAVKNVARWDGTGWNPVGAGLDSGVYSLTIDSSGVIYAGGAFTKSGETAVSNIARWDGISWTGLAEGVSASASENSRVTSTSFDQYGNLFAVGTFNVAGGIRVNDIAIWDGSAWGPVSNVVGEHNGCRIRSMVTDSSGNIYVGGQFHCAGGKNVNNIAKWDGRTWTSLGEGLGNMKDGELVLCLAIASDDTLYAGGFFKKSGETTLNNIAKWDGSSWSTLGGGFAQEYDEVTALAMDSSGILYAGGRFPKIGSTTVNNVARWDGTSWSAVGGGVTGEYIGVRSLVFDGSGNLYAGGLFSKAGDVPANNVARWDGATWAALGEGISYSDDQIPVVDKIVIDKSGNLYVGGAFNKAGSLTANNTAKWNGSSWSALGDGLTSSNGSFVLCMEVDANDNVYAGGFFSESGETALSNIARWDGSTWSAMGSGVRKDVTSIGNEVMSLLADANGNLFAGGKFIYVGDKVSPYFTKCRIDPVFFTQMTMAVSSADAGGTLPLIGSNTVNLNRPVPISAIPFKGYHFIKWTVSGDAVVANPNSPETTANLAGPATITANFAADPPAYSLSGTVSGDIQQGVSLILSGPVSSTTMSGVDGTFAFEGLSNRSYTVTPSLSGFTFNPASRNIQINGADVTGCDFIATKNSGTRSISGKITGDAIGGVTVVLSGISAATTLSTSDGSYSFAGLVDGGYAVTPGLSGYSFTPSSRSVTIAGADQANVDFTSAAISNSGQILKLSFNSSHRESVKKTGDAYGSSSTDKFTIQTSIQLPESFNLASVGDGAEFSIDFGDYSFSDILRNAAKMKIDAERGGSANFKITQAGLGKGRTVTVQKVDIKWDKKKKLTVRITGTPLANSDTNVINLSGENDGPVKGNIDNFEVIFNNIGTGFAEDQSLLYEGKKKTSEVIKDKGKADEEAFRLIGWSAKGRN